MIQVRNPYSIRPYQHVIEPLHTYMMIAEKQYENPTYADCYNVGPDDGNCVKTGELVELFCQKWGEGASWKHISSETFHEANFLKLDCSKLKSKFNWHPRWGMEKTMEKTVEWYKLYLQGGNMEVCIKEQIRDFWNESYPSKM